MNPALCKGPSHRLKIEALLFLTCFFTFAYFHQGGGWAQNARFAMVRAIVEQHRFALDSYLIYRANGNDLARVPVSDGQFQWQDESYVLAWSDELGPVTGQRKPGQTIAVITGFAMSSDVTFHDGHFYPNKPPGTALVAVPAYFVIYHLERLLGLNPDHWKTMTCNGWLTSVLSIGVICAAGCILFFRLTCLLSDGQIFASALTTLAFAFGTMFLPYATMLHEHSLVATALLASFYLMYRACSPSAICASGICLGLGYACNYLIALVALLFFVYLLRNVRETRTQLAFVIGLLGPLCLIALYHLVCFGNPLATSYSHENPIFKNEAGFLGVFGKPRADVLLALLFSPFRGLFFASPVLAIGVWGLRHMLRTPSLKGEALVFIAVVLVFFGFNLCFLAWDGGWGTAPRYLAPAVPFLAMPVVFGFVRFFKTSCAMLIVSVAMNLLFTAVDPQSPLGLLSYLRIDGKPLWKYNQLTDYELPLFLTGRPGPILQDKIEEIVSHIDWQLFTEQCPEDVRTQRTATLRQKIRTDIEKGWSVCFDPLATSSNYRLELCAAAITGPVSANPIGMYEGGYGFVFPVGSIQSRWNSFNIGEWLFPQMRLSLLPLVVIGGALVARLLAYARGEHFVDHAKKEFAKQRA